MHKDNTQRKLGDLPDLSGYLKGDGMPDMRYAVNKIRKKLGFDGDKLRGKPIFTLDDEMVKRELERFIEFLEPHDVGTIKQGDTLIIEPVSLSMKLEEYIRERKTHGHK